MLNTATSPENAQDIEILSAALSDLPVGATIEYGTLTEAIGRDIQAHRWLLQAAVKAIETETGSLYETVRNVGVKRLPPEDLPGVGLNTIRKVRRASKKGYHRLAAVRTNSLSPEDAAKIIAHRSQLGAISMVADGRKTATLTKEVTDTNGATIAAGRVLDLFKS